jgi:hypothetical protein
MKYRAIVTTILLLFVTASLAYLVVGERGARTQAEIESTGTVHIDPAPVDPATTGGATGTLPAAVPPSDLPAAAPAPDLPASSPAELPRDTYINVYYFHGNYRCITCRTIEMYTREAINEAFLTELGNGTLHLRILNMQDPANEAYVKDFGLEYYIVVLEKVVDGKRVEWKKLEGVWDLLKDKDAFKKYVVGETRGYLDGVDR